MIDLNLIRERFDLECRSVSWPGGTIAMRPHVTRREIDSQHSISWSDLNEQNANHVIAEEISHHRALGVGFEWKAFASDRPAELVSRLAAHGFEIGAPEAVMVFDLAMNSQWPPANEAARVEVVKDSAGLAAFRRVAEEVFDKDYAFTTNQLAAALEANSDGHRGYVAYIGDEPAGVGRLYTNPNSWFGGLYGGGTRPFFRGRGVYHAMLAARARDAIHLGARFLLIDALPTSRPIVERLGFEHLDDTWPCEWRPNRSVPDERL